MGCPKQEKFGFKHWAPQKHTQGRWIKEGKAQLGDAQLSQQRLPRERVNQDDYSDSICMSLKSDFLYCESGLARQKWNLIPTKHLWQLLLFFG